jgi:hypothetical protein
MFPSAEYKRWFEEYVTLNRKYVEAQSAKDFNAVNEISKKFDEFQKKSRNQNDNKVPLFISKNQA